MKKVFVFHIFRIFPMYSVWLILFIDKIYVARKKFRRESWIRKVEQNEGIQEQTPDQN